MNATKTKTTKIDTLRPPRDIREQTVARRLWLEAERDRINAMPNRMAKIVGKGSYQEVSVYEVTEVEGRLRLRGVCQCCGNSQVVEGEPGVLVLHGYKRPGDGQTYGRCPGMGKLPLNDDDSWTKTWALGAEEEVATWTVKLAEAEARYETAGDALYTNGDVLNGERLETDAYETRPRSRTERELRDVAAWKEYETAKAAWAAQFPLTAEYEAAEAARGAASTNLWRWKQTAKHYNNLLNSGIKGTPLTREVVA